MRKFIDKFWPVIFLFIIWFIFAHPYFLKDKAPFPSTYQVNNFAPWSADDRFAGPVKNGAMPDIITQIYPWRHLAVEIWKSGEVPLWNPNSFSGTPLLANYQSAVLSPFNILFLLIPFADAWSLLVLVQPLLAGLFMYLFVRSLNRGKVASLISSISFMFCGFITVWMGYATLPFAFLFLPLALFCIEKYYQTSKSMFLLLLSVCVPLSFFSGHFQISLYFLLTTIAYIVYKFFITRNLLNTLYLILYTSFGLLLSMPQLLPSIEFYSQSLRSLVFEKNEVIPWGYISTFLAPDFLGNPVTRNDWFGHYAEWNAYIGVLPLILAVYSIFGKQKSKTIFFFALAILILSLAFPTPLQDLFINLRIPVLSTSAASRIIVIYSFLFAVLSGFGFDQLLADIQSKKYRKILIWLLTFGSVLLALWAVIYFKLFIPEERIIVARSNLILPSVIFMISAFTVFIASMNKKLLLSLSCVLLLIVSFDMLRFTIKWMPFDPKNLVFIDTPTTQSFSKIAGYNRIFSNLGGEATTYYNLPSVEGYDSLYIKRYGEFIGFVNNENSKNLNRSVVLFSKNGKYASKAINLLDIKYIIHKIADDHAVWTFPYWTYPDDQFKLIYKDDMYEFYENTKISPHAFLVGQYKVEKNADQTLSLMFNDNLDLRRKIILEKDPKISQSIGEVGEAKIISYKPNNIEISVDAKDKSLLFLSENYYPGWNASVDGKETPILRANYTFRAIPVEAGKHTIQFSYMPWSFKLGLYLASGGLIGAIFMILVSRRTNRSKPSSS
ncbi:MAG: YfhO family protein [Candidatus Levybacteria bacterium]|nr:YfhO family protein [Candidatus Levybacteria bacterium]